MRLAAAGRGPPYPAADFRMAAGSASLGVLFLTVLLDLLGFGLVIPLVQPYVDHYWRMESPDSAYVARIATALSACYSAAQFLFAPMWGALSDRIGRRPVLLTTIPLLGLAYLLFGLVADENVNHYFLPNVNLLKGDKVIGTVVSGHAVVYALFATRTLGGVFAANISTAFAYVADVTTPANRAKGMGMIGAAFGIGFTIGPSVGGVLAHEFGRGAPGYAAAALALVNSIWAVARLKESLPPEKRGALGPRRGRLELLREQLSTPALGRLLLLSFLATFAFAHMEQGLSLFLKLEPERGGRGYGEHEIGYAFGYIGIVAVIVQGGLMRSLGKRYGERPLILLGWTMLAFGLAGIGYFGWASFPLAMLAAAGLFMAVGNSISNPSLSSLISRTAPATAQGSVFGANQSMGSLARIFGPLSAGWFADSLTRAAPMYVAAAGTLVAIAVFLTLPRAVTAKAVHESSG